MKVSAAIAEIMRREGVTDLICYPRNGVIEAAAEAGIRPILVRQERTGVHMADALGRVTCGDRVGVFAMQQGPGTENAFGGVAQAYAESVPLVVIPAGHARAQAGVKPNFSASVNFRNVTKSVEQGDGSLGGARCDAPCLQPREERPSRPDHGRGAG